MSGWTSHTPFERTKQPCGLSSLPYYRSTPNRVRKAERLFGRHAKMENKEDITEEVVEKPVKFFKGTPMDDSRLKESAAAWEKKMSDLWW